jgi:hypothetical protein
MRPHLRPNLGCVSGCPVATIEAKKHSPITQHTNENLTNDDTKNLHVRDSGDPVLTADLVLLPARTPGSLEQRGQVANGEEHVTKDPSAPKRSQWRKNRNIPLETETGTWQDRVAEVPANWAQRISLHHGANGTELLLGLSGIDSADERRALKPWQISPVHTIGVVAVIWLDEVVEDGLLVGGIAVVWERGMVGASVWAMGDRDGTRGRVMDAGVVEAVVVRHGDLALRCAEKAAR